MTGKKASTSAVIFGGWLALLIEVVLITALLWAGLRGLRHEQSPLTIGYFAAAAMLLVRYALFGRPR